MNEKNDIDFDALDKAVSSLMGKVGSETLEDSEKTKELDINSTLQPTEQPKYDALGDIAKTIGNETLVTDAEIELTEDLDKSEEGTTEPATSASTQPQPETPSLPPQPKPTTPIIGRPNSGRFMDVVHPSSDMRSAAPTPAKPLAVPFNPPKPIVSPLSPKPLSPVTPNLSPAPAPRPNDVPVTTPFLPEAKVEKRPLGGMAAGEWSSPTTNEEKPAPETNIALEEPEPTEDLDPQRALNAEELAHESSTAKELQKIEAVELTGVPSQTIETVESGDTEKLKGFGAGTMDGQGAAPTPIYDTQQYHQPIAHPAKQKSGWGVIVIIIVIIVVAVVGAAAAYLYFGLSA